MKKIVVSLSFICHLYGAIDTFDQVFFVRMEIWKNEKTIEAKFLRILFPASGEISPSIIATIFFLF